MYIISIFVSLMFTGLLSYLNGRVEVKRDLPSADALLKCPQ